MRYNPLYACTHPGFFDELLRRVISDPALTSMRFVNIQRLEFPRFVSLRQRHLILHRSLVVREL